MSPYEDGITESCPHEGIEYLGRVLNGQDPHLWFPNSCEGKVSTRHEMGGIPATTRIEGQEVQVWADYRYAGRAVGRHSKVFRDESVWGEWGLSLVGLARVGKHEVKV